MPRTSTITEMLLVIHLEGLPLTLLESAALIEVFRKEFPLSQEGPALPPTTLDAFSQPVLSFIEAPRLPRTILRSASLPYALQFQLDRFAFSWTRNSPLGEDVDYPGYDHIKDKWIKYAKDFYDHCTRIAQTSPQIRLLEIGYYNTLPMDKEDGSKHKLSELFKFVSPAEGRRVSRFDINWTEPLLFEANSPVVRGSLGVGMLAGPSLEGQHVAYFNFTGAGLAAGSLNELDSFIPLADGLHAKLVDVYKSSIILENQ